MKNFSFCLFLFAIGNLFAQNTYSLQKEESIYDIPGGDFLAARIQNDKAHIRHFDSLGTVLWEGDLSFQLPLDTVTFEWIANFKGTSEYVICMSRDLTLNTPRWEGFDNDTIAYQFTKFDLSNHQFENSLVDTFYTQNIRNLEFADTSILIFIPNYSGSVISYLNSIHSLNPSLEITSKLTVDSTSISDETVYFTKYHKVYKNQILNYCVINQELSFDPSITYPIHNECFSTHKYFNNIEYLHPINEDSIFIFTQGTMPMIKYGIAWSMNWVKFDLTSLKSIEFKPPPTSTPNPVFYFETGAGNIEIDKINKRIIIHSTNWNSNSKRKVFVYDYNFNLICDREVENETVEFQFQYNTLTSLNGYVYVNSDLENGEQYKRVDCNNLDILEIENATKMDELVISPNPTNQYIHLSSDQNEGVVELIQMNGTVLQSWEIDSVGKQLDVSNFQSGVYLLRLNTQHGSVTKRIIKN